MSSKYFSNVTVSNGTGINWEIDTRDKQTIDFIEFVLKIIGVDLTFDDFKNLTEEEKQSLLRDIKIEKIINN